MLLTSAADRTLPAEQRYGALFMASIAVFCLRKLTGEQPGQLTDLLVIASCASCGWSWLLTRALFAAPGTASSSWPLVVVLLLTAAGAVLQFQGDEAGGLSHLVGNFQGLVSSCVLLLAIAEPLRTWHKDFPRHELAFRLAFAAAYAALVGVSAVWINHSPEGSFGARSGDSVKMVCALLALVIICMALRYRALHPLPARSAARRVVPAPDEVLAARIRQLMADESLHAETSLRVADLATRLAEAEYKVSRCITGTLGFRNFNHMVNHFRIQRATSMLADPCLDHLPVLSIALDCGFGSIGPFNRAFKLETGITPTQFRGDARRARGPHP